MSVENENNQSLQDVSKSAQAILDQKSGDAGSNLGIDPALPGFDKTVLTDQHGNEIKSHVNDLSLPGGGAGTGDLKTQEANSSVDSQLKSQSVAKEQEQLKHTGPVGIDYTNPEEREKTLEEHRKENEENFKK